MKTDYADCWPVVHSTPCMARLRFEDALRRLSAPGIHKRRKK